MNSNSPKNDSSPLQNIFSWVKNTPERAIDGAFEAAVSIKRIEEENFNGNKIANDGSFGSSVFSVFEIQLQKYLRIVGARLSFYKVSASLPYFQTQSSSNLANTAIAKYAANNQGNDPVGNGQLSANQLGGNSRRFSIYQKLAFIDYTLERYNRASDQTIDVDAKPSVNNNFSTSRQESEIEEPDEKFQLFKNTKSKNYKRPIQQVASVEKSILPGSFFKAFDRVKRNLSGSYVDYEKDIVEELRQSRQRINQALRYIGVLIISVIAVQFLSKILIFSPMINSFIDTNRMTVKFSPAVEEKAFIAMRLAKERIEFDYMIKSIVLEPSPDKQEPPKSELSQESEITKSDGIKNVKKKVGEAPKLSASEEVESLVQQESMKILKRFNDASFDGIKN